MSSSKCWAGLDLSGVDAKRVVKCKRCGSEIVWLTSTRTGKNYPVNFKGLIDVNKTDFHRCNDATNEKGGN